MAHIEKPEHIEQLERVVLGKMREVAWTANAERMLLFKPMYNHQLSLGETLTNIQRLVKQRVDIHMSDQKLYWERVEVIYIVEVGIAAYACSLTQEVIDEFPSNCYPNGFTIDTIDAVVSLYSSPGTHAHCV